MAFELSDSCHTSAYIQYMFDAKIISTLKCSYFIVLVHLTLDLNSLLIPIPFLTIESYFNSPPQRLRNRLWFLTSTPISAHTLGFTLTLTIAVDFKFNPFYGFQTQLQQGLLFFVIFWYYKSQFSIFWSYFNIFVFILNKKLKIYTMG